MNKPRTRLAALLLALTLLSGSALAEGIDVSPTSDELSFEEAASMLASIFALDEQPTSVSTRNMSREMLPMLIARFASYESLGLNESATYGDLLGDSRSAGTIEYCVSQGIVTGNLDGSFTPTPLSAAKMLLAALGYGDHNGQFNSFQWGLDSQALLTQRNANMLIELVQAQTPAESASDDTPNSLPDLLDAFAGEKDTSAVISKGELALIVTDAAADDAGNVSAATVSGVLQTLSPKHIFVISETAAVVLPKSYEITVGGEAVSALTLQVGDAVQLDAREIGHEDESYGFKLTLESP